MGWRLAGWPRRSRSARSPHTPNQPGPIEADSISSRHPGSLATHRGLKPHKPSADQPRKGLIEKTSHVTFFTDSSLRKIARTTTFAAKRGEAFAQQGVHVRVQPIALRENHVALTRGQQYAHVRLSNDFRGDHPHIGWVLIPQYFTNHAGPPRFSGTTIRRQQHQRLKLRKLLCKTLPRAMGCLAFVQGALDHAGYFGSAAGEQSCRFAQQRRIQPCRT